MRAGRVGVYKRVSDDEQHVENQALEIERYVTQHMLSVVEEYSDEGWCGEIPVRRRPDGARMLRDAQAGKIDTVLVYSISRLGREMLDSIGVVKELQREYGISFISIKEPVDTRTPAGMLMLQQFAAWAEWERATILERTALGSERIAREGRWVGGKWPYGYRVNSDRRLEEDPVTAPIVRRMYALYIEGLTGYQIAALLNAESIPTPNATKGVNKDVSRGWYGEVVLDILKSRTYIGEASYRKRQTIRKEGVVLGLEPSAAERQILIPCPPLIDTEAWERAQSRIAQNKHKCGHNASRRFLLSGLLRCGCCGLHYIGAGAVGCMGKKYTYYRCNGRTHRENYCPNAMNLRAEELEEHVWNAVADLLSHPGKVIERLKERIQQQKAALQGAERSADETERLIEEKQVERQRIIGLAKKGLLTDEEQEAELQKTMAEIAALREAMEIVAAAEREARAAYAQLPAMEEVLEGIRQMVLGATVEDRQHLLQLFVKEIVIHPRGHVGRRPQADVEIRYRLGDSSSAETHSPLCLSALELISRIAA